MITNTSRIMEALNNGPQGRSKLLTSAHIREFNRHHERIRSHWRVKGKTFYKGLKRTVQYQLVMVALTQPLRADAAWTPDSLLALA